MPPPITPSLREALEKLILDSNVRSISCHLDDLDLWRVLVAEQIRRAKQFDLPPQEAFCLCGPDSGLPNIPFETWGGEVHIPYEGLCDGDLLLLPSWRRFSPERLTSNGRFSYAIGKNCNYLLVEGDYGELRGATRENFGEWTLYSSINPTLDCNPFVDETSYRLRAKRLD